MELRDGRTLDIQVVTSDSPPLPRADARKIVSFIVDPLQPWFSSAEQEFLAYVLRGEGRPSLRDVLVVGRMDGELAGTSWHGTSASNPEIGVVAYVRTDPVLRGLGVGSALVAASHERLCSEGGRIAYLGTTNPAARPIYERIGFRAWTGVAMRADCGGSEVALAPDDATLALRDAVPGDVGAWTHLLVGRSTLPWRMRNFSEDVYFAPPGTQISSCVRPFNSTWMRWTTTGVGAFKVLADASGRIAATASVLDLGRGPSLGTGTVEFLVDPGHLEAMPGLLKTTVDDAASSGRFRQLVAYADNPVREALLRAVGFRRTHLLHGAVVLNGEATDLIALRLPLTARQAPGG